MFENKPLTFLNLVISAVYLGLLVFLFHSQALSPLVAADVRISSSGWMSPDDARYISDLAPHLKIGLNPEATEYSLFGFVIKTLGQFSDPYYSVPLLLALLVVGSVWGTRLLLGYLAPTAKSPVLWLVSWLAAFATALWVPGLPVKSSFSISSALWHNPTFLSMKFMAIFCLYFYFKTHENYLEKFNWKPWLPFTLFLTMGTMIKPSFFIAFAPVMALFLLWDLIRTRGRGLPRVLLFSSSVIPSLAASLYQAHLLFRAGAARDRIGFAFGELQFKSDITLVLLGHLLSVVFPLLAYVLLPKYFRGRFEFKVLTLTFLLALFQAWFFFEDGSRYWHGNFGWGLRLGCFLLFIAAGAVLAQWVATWKEGGQSFQARWSTCCLLWGCLIWHALSGLGFFAHLLTGADFWDY